MSRTAFILSLVCLSGHAAAARPPALLSRAQEVSHAAQQQAPAADELTRLREQTRRRKSDPEAWYDYGEALARSGDTRGTAKAFGEAVKRYVRIHTDWPDFDDYPTQEQAARRHAEMGVKLRRAPEAVERYLGLGGARSAPERARLEALGAHARMLGEQDPRRAVFLASELDRKAVITYKPEPGFTEEARQNNTKGRAKLRAVLTREGTVEHIFVLRSLPDGLTDNCVEAARRIRFEPALKGGTAVSQFIILEYHFNIY